MLVVYLFIESRSLASARAIKRVDPFQYVIDAISRARA